MAVNMATYDCISGQAKRRKLSGWGGRGWAIQSNEISDSNNIKRRQL